MKWFELILIFLFISFIYSCGGSKNVGQIKVEHIKISDEKNLCFDGNFETTKEIVNYKPYGDVTIKVLDEIGKKWHCLLNLGADAIMKVENGFVHTKIIFPGTDYLAIQLLQLPFKICEGKVYKVSFEAKALEPRTIVSVNV